MSELTLISDFSLDTTSLSNIYIDEYMSENNESQIKIYLYLLRNLSKGVGVSVISIADTFNYSVTDVERALIFMEKQGLMSLKMENGGIVGLRLLPLKKRRADMGKDSVQMGNLWLMETPENENRINENKSSVIEKPEYSAEQISEFCKEPKIEELMFVIQQYIGKPLSPSDLKSLKYMNDALSFDAEMIEYLVEYCADNGKKTFRHFEKVAKTWYENGVFSVSEARLFINDMSKEVYDVFKAFAIKSGSRKPSSKEIGFVRRWTKELAFGMDVISKACEITIDKTHTVSFEYADAILTDWNKKGVKNPSDIEKLNKNNSSENNKVTKKQGRAGGNAFNNFTGRDYDFAQLERELWSN